MSLRLPFLLACYLIYFVTSPVQADWGFTPRVLLAEAYTDNRSLVTDAQKESAYITQVVPGFSLARANKNLLLNLDYQLESIFYDNSLKESNVFHQFDLTVSKKLPGDWASFEVAASNQQTNVNSRGALPGNNLFLSSNRTNISTLSFGPVFRWRPRSYLLGELSLQRGTVQYDNVARADNEQWRGRLSIDATQYPGKIGWTFLYSTLRSDNDITNTSTFRQTSADFYFRVSSRTALIAGVGWDDNRFQSAPGLKQEGGSWRFGFNWSPRRLTTFSVFYNNRYYGESAEVSIQNQSRYTTVAINFRESLELPGQARIASLAGLGRTPIQNQGTVSMEVAKIQRGTLSIARRHSKTETSLEFSQYNREFQESLVRENRDGIRIGWRWMLSEVSTIDISGRKQRLYFSDINRADDFRTVSVEFLHRLGRRISFGTSISHISRASSDASVEYISNTFMCSVSGQI